MKKVVTIGGGTGSFMLLSGLKKYPLELSAIVSMADDGGSTGILRDELGVLPPGDVRQCLVALSDSSDTLRELMNYRFVEGGLSGHSFGNLFLSALEKITGSFTKGVLEASQILNVKGEVIPVTDTDTKLFLKLKSKKLLSGENEINHSSEMSAAGVEKIYLSPTALANPLALKKIREADLIIIGPGNHYCAILPNLLVKGIAETIRQAKAKVVYNCNLVNKRGQTDTFALDDYVTAVEKYIGKDRVDFVTYNKNVPDEALMKKYAKEGGLVPFEKESNTKRRFRVIRADLLSRAKVRVNRADKIAATRAFIRHDADKLAKVLVMLLELGEYESILRDIV